MATVAIAAGLTVAPQLASAVQAAPGDCGFPPPAPASHTVTCNGVTHYYSFTSTSYYYRLTCYNFFYSSSAGYDGPPMVTTCRPGYG